jgi:hypothetical protein
MAAILSCHSMLSHRPLRRGCLIEFLYPTGYPWQELARQKVEERAKGPCLRRGYPVSYPSGRSL